MKILRAVAVVSVVAGQFPAAAGERLEASPAIVSTSAVAGVKHEPATVRLTNRGPAQLPLDLQIAGENAGSFAIVPPFPAILAANESATLHLDFHPGGKAGRYRAELRTAGVVIPLEGLATDALEGENEPPLDRIVRCLGIPLDVGGPALRLDLKAAKIGDSVVARKFRRAGDRAVRITPLARYSPPGAYPIGWSAAGPHVVGTLADSGKTPDAHQRLFPPLEGGESRIEFTPDEEPFSVFVKAGKHTVGTDPGAFPPDLPNAVRIYPVSALQGAPVRNGFLVCIEEASNGDYQDTVLLVENVAIAP